MSAYIECYARLPHSLRANKYCTTFNTPCFPLEFWLVFKRLQRIPTALVERTSLARGALPILPKSLAWLCLVLNGFLPGTGNTIIIFCQSFVLKIYCFLNWVVTGTILSGLLGTCLGAPRFSPLVTVEHKFLALVINLTVGIFQAVTVLFCLVGWCWSLGWGIILVKTAGRKDLFLKCLQAKPAGVFYRKQLKLRLLL